MQALPFCITNLIDMSAFLSHWNASMPTATKRSRIKKDTIRVSLLLKTNL